MRRKEKEITDRQTIESILMRARVCRLAFTDGEVPYMVPLCFGYRDNTLYFHSAREGKKIEIIKKNPGVCFEVDVDHELVRAGMACDWGMKFRSVIGFGRAALLEDPETKRMALDVIMEHYGADGPFVYKEKGFEKALIIRVEIESMTGKQSGYDDGNSRQQADGNRQ